MKKKEYYESTLKDLKKELTRQNKLISGLTGIRQQLEGDKYQPIEPLDDVLKDLDERRKTVRGAVKRIEEMVK